jgi:hypothetical protein
VEYCWAQVEEKLEADPDVDCVQAKPGQTEVFASRAAEAEAEVPVGTHGCSTVDSDVWVSMEDGN